MSRSEAKTRCEWVKLSNPLYVHYHDEEWGRPSHDPQHLFEMICLEGQQAGLSWETVLNKREAYRRCFHDFDVERVASMTDKQIDTLLQNPELIRNRLKLYSIRSNAQAVLALDDSSLPDLLWRYVDGKPIINHWRDIKSMPAHTEISDQMSKDLKKLGFKFVGTTICYSLMQAVGLVNDHTQACFLSGDA